MGLSKPFSMIRHLYVIWSVVRCGGKNVHHKDMYLKEIGLRAHHMLIILGSIMNIRGGGVYMAIYCS